MADVIQCQELSRYEHISSTMQATLGKQTPAEPPNASGLLSLPGSHSHPTYGGPPTSTIFGQRLLEPLTSLEETFTTALLNKNLLPSLLW